MSKKEEEHNLDPKPPIENIDQDLYRFITEYFNDLLNPAIETPKKQEQGSKKASEEQEHPRKGSNELSPEEIEASLKKLLNVQPVEDFKKPNEDDPTKGFNASSSGIVINSGSLKKLKALFNAPVLINIKQLRDKTSRFMSEGKGFQGMGGRMHALLSDGEDTDFKNAEGDGKKSFLELLKECDESDYNWETLKAFKITAVDQGTALSRLFVDLLFLMPNGNKLVEKFKVIATSLKWVCEDENNSVVIRRIVDLLDTADTEMRKKLESKKKRIRVVGVELGASWFQSIDQEDPLDEDGTDISIIELLKETFRLECFWMHRGLLDSKQSIKDAVPSLLAEQKECKEAMKTIELGVKDLIESYVDIKESDELRLMYSKINELWNLDEESEKEN